MRLGGGAERVVSTLVGGDRALVCEHDVHPGAQRRRHRLRGVVRGDVHEHRVRERVTGYELDRFGRAGAPGLRLCAGGLRERRPLRFRRGQRREPRGSEATRVEHESAAVDQPDDTQRQTVTLHLRDHRGQRPSDLPEPEQHDVGALRLRHRTPADLRELECGVHHALGPRRVLAVHYERQVQLGRTLGRGDHIDPGFRERREHPGCDARRLRHA